MWALGAVLFHFATGGTIADRIVGLGRVPATTAAARTHSLVDTLNATLTLADQLRSPRRGSGSGTCALRIQFGRQAWPSPTDGRPRGYRPRAPSATSTGVAADRRVWGTSADLMTFDPLAPSGDSPSSKPTSSPFDGLDEELGRCAFVIWTTLHCPPRRSS